jgi:hypothetical protein
MLITIPFSSLTKEVKELFVANKLKSFGIDYQPNALMAWNGDKEIEVYNFSRICKLDNRFCSYEIYFGPTEILIEFIY